jgi:hypothetical protein
MNFFLPPTASETKGDAATGFLSSYYLEQNSADTNPLLAMTAPCFILNGLPRNTFSNKPL